MFADRLRHVAHAAVTHESVGANVGRKRVRSDDGEFDSALAVGHKEIERQDAKNAKGR